MASSNATAGPAGSRHGLLATLSTTMSDPRLPAAPPHGPPVARTSAAVQAATAEALGAPLDGGADKVADGGAEALGVGLGALLQAPTASAPNTARITMDERLKRPACAMVGLVTTPAFWARTILPRPGRSGRTPPRTCGPARCRIGPIATHWRRSDSALEASCDPGSACTCPATPSPTLRLRGCLTG